MYADPDFIIKKHYKKIKIQLCVICFPDTKAILKKKIKEHTLIIWVSFERCAI